MATVHFHHNVHLWMACDDIFLERTEKKNIQFPYEYIVLIQEWKSLNICNESFVVITHYTSSVDR